MSEEDSTQDEMALSAAIIARLEPNWTVYLAMSEYQAEWLIACLHLHRADHPSALADRMIDDITAQIKAMHDRRRT